MLKGSKPYSFSSESSHPAGACNHALGFYKAATKDYSRAFAIQAENLSEELRQFQALAFLQVGRKAVALQII